ncbi:FliC/FljB family flagellin [Chromohalobacter israelensis]|uniref:Flagellin n=1 Tax=Chromohalobacter israelensis (strain ATCC BAA-138 / DSM 3043 / CIP 106854 / NCIMB 13768 / 1H11) TaxID=290398 RepID=Q1QW21_CHRI1|nr:FliC/FljB family flagellin [Chromohalobacter salexigens]ABE59337.1 flagellin-like protein [Chromohalobacter salexigens DSM 3043]
MAVINTNITAMIGQQNLSQSQSALSTSMERLSSGLRINSAADDAAGQAIANRMSSQITGLSQAQRNANDGISVAQTTEGALNQVNDNLQRVRELTVQAQNGTNSQEDLDSIQDEINQRLGEIDRISEETSFNGVDVLASDQEISIQVGSEDGQTITMNLQEVNAETLGLSNFDVSDRAESVSAGGYDSGSTVAADDATFSFTDSTGAVSDFDGYSVVENDSGTFVRDDQGNYYDATMSVASADTSSVGVTFDSDSALTADELSTNGLSPLADIDAAISNVDSQRSELGAMQNRFDSAITNLSTTETNLSSARSRIEDADYADEVSNMTRNQILQQAGTSVLAQANQLPQNALSLLG